MTMCYLSSPYIVVSAERASFTLALFVVLLLLLLQERKRILTKFPEMAELNDEDALQEVLANALVTRKGKPNDEDEYLGVQGRGGVGKTRDC